MIPVGVGGSFTVPPVTSLLIDSVSAHQAGAASGVLNTFRQMGGSLGVAVFGAVVAQTALLRGLRVSFLATAVLLVLGAAGTLTMRRSDPTDSVGGSLLIDTIERTAKCRPSH
jgi:DHA2 family methylenomycin A resistance protein-like MFS transporter